MDKAHILTSMQLAWALANGEASLSGREIIEPAHFLMALLTLREPGFLDEAGAAGSAAST